MSRRENPQTPMPGGVARRIAERSARNEVVVVVPRRGKPARVYVLEKYLKMKEQPKKHKPWSYRKDRPNPPDPLGAVNGSILMPLTRENIYQ